ncbi:MAG: hypothetical protein COY81_01265 [Candidatus Pacebacteria bacterium CG_4_10_14_0_8_um_filter_43_12]|nr:MAG: hypothetical protein COY81_01265 [Candidatus Pacebacteria bacterium CG_4_10_14_0_8_um_filter_43_12]
MGALPKNKITRAERGKRRAGNRPNLKKDPKVTAVPLSKRGLVASILTATGLSPAKVSQLTKRQHEAKNARDSKSAKTKDGSHQMSRESVKPAARAPQAIVKPTRITQHKG